ncbi:heterokaryon incompatibility protein-domain-containing protein [Bisporella sp. PMI_857]|nr:heterokaryon incompatibility protein-domain-containing protein [Bisporella sp. PMI_857]
MRRLFRRHRKKPAEDLTLQASSLSTPQASTLSKTPHRSTSFNTPQASAPGTHVCTSLCDGLSSGTPNEFKVANIKITNARLISGERRDMGTELDERRAIEGNTDLSRIPLALPTTYQYPQLPKGHARFLRPGTLGSHPLAWLESHSLANPPSYVAISYCWDANSPRRGTFLDMKSFGISETVLEVLNQVASQYVRRTHELLWINQDDPDEKLDQICRMGEIYSKAETVFIWLGPTADNSDAALENMPRMLNEAVAMNEATMTRTELPDDTTVIINAGHGWNYGHLFSRQWFCRLWTIQEALLARRLVIMCGYREVNFELLDALVYQLVTYGSLDLIQLRDIFDEDLRLEMHTFQSLVMESRARHVTEADDRVFTLMGVAPRRIREHMAALYAQFAKCMLESDPEWYFLSLAPSKDRPVELPSWVLNLNSQQPYTSAPAKPSSGFSAGISPETQHLISRSITTEELTARGFCLDTVAKIIPQTAFTEEKQNMKHSDMYGIATSEWEMKCIQLCQNVYDLGPGQFPALQANILVAQSTTKPAMDGRTLKGYHFFSTICRVTSKIFRQANQGQLPVPEHYRRFPDGASRYISKAVNTFWDGLSVEDYGLLLQFVGTR